MPRGNHFELEKTVSRINVTSPLCSSGHYPMRHVVTSTPFWLAATLALFTEVTALLHRRAMQLAWGDLCFLTQLLPGDNHSHDFQGPDSLDINHLLSGPELLSTQQGKQVFHELPPEAMFPTAFSAVSRPGAQVSPRDLTSPPSFSVSPASPYPLDLLPVERIYSEGKLPRPCTANTAINLFSHFTQRSRGVKTSKLGKGPSPRTWMAPHYYLLSPLLSDTSRRPGSSYILKSQTVVSSGHLLWGQSSFFPNWNSCSSVLRHFLEFSRITADFFTSVFFPSSIHSNIRSS